MQKENAKTKSVPIFIKILLNIFYGVVIGATMLVPGASGGTMAIILGIYDELIKSVSNIFKKFKESFLFILQISVGAIIGILLLSKLMLNLIENNQMIMMYIFMGAVLGSIPALWKKSGISKFNPGYILWVFVGAVIMFLLGLIPKNNFNASPNSIESYLMLILCGVIIAVALVLPGISTSHMLLILGMYEAVWGAVNKLDFLYLLPILVGVILGVLATTKILDKAMTKLPKQTYLIIIGFVLASLVDMFPGLPSGIEVVFCLFASAIAMVLIMFVSR